MLIIPLAFLQTFRAAFQKVLIFMDDDMNIITMLNYNNNIKIHQKVHTKCYDSLGITGERIVPWAHLTKELI